VRWTAAQHRNSAKALAAQNEELARFYAGRCGKPILDFEVAVRGEQMMTAMRAKRLGLVHTILDKGTAKLF
jgi:ATP-dependent protease ClpP protease subunit